MKGIAMLWVLLISLGAIADESPVLLTVDGATRLALERSRDLRDARLALTEARGRVSEAWGDVYPHIDYSASYVRNISPAVSFVPAQLFDPTAAADDFLALQFGADNSWQSAFTIEQPLFDPGIFIGLGAAERYERLQAELVRGRAQQVATRVRLNCYELLLRAEEVRLTERSLERVRQALAETRARFSAGLASEYDVLRLEVELANLEPNLLRARNGLLSARRRLAVELDAGDPEAVQLADESSLGGVDVGTPSPSPPDELVRAAQDGRSDLRQLERTAELRRTQVRRERSEYLPRVSLFGSWEIQAQQNGGPNFFGDERTRATSKMAGVVLRVPLFTGLQRHARIGQRRAALRQAETQTQLARDQAEAEVRDLAGALDEAHARAAGQRLAVGQAERGFQIALARFGRGVGSQLEVTDAEVALRQSEFHHAQAAHDVLATLARLDLATGRIPIVDEYLEEGP